MRMACFRTAAAALVHEDFTTCCSIIPTYRYQPCWAGSARSCLGGLHHGVEVCEAWDRVHDGPEALQRTQCNYREVRARHIEAVCAVARDLTVYVVRLQSAAM